MVALLTALLVSSLPAKPVFSTPSTTVTEPSTITVNVSTTSTGASLYCTSALNTVPPAPARTAANRCGVRACSFTVSNVGATTFKCMASTTSRKSKIATSPIYTVNAYVPPGGDETRPAWNTGTGFFVKNAKLYDAAGVQFKIAGVNVSHPNDFGQPFCDGGTGAQCGLANSGANAVRWVAGLNQTALTGDSWWEQSSAIFANTLVANRLVSIPGCFFPASCLSGTACVDTPACLTECVSYIINNRTGPYPITSPALDPYTIINLANEWGTPSGTIWRDAYITAVTNMRNAGFTNTLMIDLPNCGYDDPSLSALTGDAQAVFNADPQHNLIFGYHSYVDTIAQGDHAPWATQIANIVAAQTAQAHPTWGGFPVAIMEFAINTTCWGGNVPPTTIMASAVANGIGWAAWGWDDTQCDIMLTSSPKTGNFPLITSGPATGEPANCTNPGPCTTSPCNCAATSNFTSNGNNIVFSKPNGLFYGNYPKASNFP